MCYKNYAFISLMIMFGMFILALLIYMKKNRPL
ncbi:putative holin-like toxin [Paenibacillus terrae]